MYSLPAISYISVLIFGLKFPWSGLFQWIFYILVYTVYCLTVLILTFFLSKVPIGSPKGSTIRAAKKIQSFLFSRESNISSW